MRENIKLLILNKLQEQSKQFVSAKYLAESINISERTVYRYISSLNQDLASHDIQIVSIPGLGYQLSQSVVGKDMIDAMVSIDFGQELSLQVYLIEHLLFSRPIYIEKILSTFFISESTLHKIIQAINRGISPQGVRIGIKKGNIVLKGTSVDIVKVFAGLFISIELQHDQKRYHQVFDLKSCLNDKIKTVASQYLKGVDIAGLDERIIEWSLFVSLCRKYSQQHLYSISPQVLLEQSYIEVDKICETLYLFTHNDMENRIADTMDSALSLFFGESFRQSQQFCQTRQSLLLHLKSLLKQKQLGITVENGMLKIIQERYAFELSIAGLLAYQLELQFGIHFTKDDIGFIALYLATIHNQNRRLDDRLKTIIISDGLSSGYLLREELLTSIPEIEVCAVVTEWEVPTVDFSQYQFIISLVSLELSVNIPISYVLNPFQTDFIGEIQKELGRLRIIRNYQDLIASDVVLLTEDSVDGVIAELVSNVVSQDDMIDRITKQILDREELASTAAEENIALPHTITSEPLPSKIIIGISEKGIKWGNNIVKLVILSIFSTQDSSGGAIFRKIYNFIKNKKLVSKTISERTNDYLFHYLEGENE